MVKIGDIAKATGVSVTTVSKALNGYSDISEKTKEMIIDKSKEMGYVPNASARSLVMKRSFTIGVILDDASHDGLEHPFFAGVVQAFRVAIERKGYDMLMISNEIGRSPVDSYLNHCRQRSVDGILILCTDIAQEGVRELLESDIPSVFFDMPNEPVNSVFSDHYKGARDAMNYLIKLGHKKIGHIYGNDSTYAGYERRKAYMDALHENNLPFHADYLQDGGYFEFERGLEAMRALLDLKDPPTAVFAAGDTMALGAMKCCYDRRLRIPDDISIIGFDNIRMLEWTTPRLTSVDQNYKLLGSECVQILIERIENHNTQDLLKVKIPTHLVIGETCRKIRISQ